MRVRYSFSSRRTGVIEGSNKHKIAFPKLAREVIRISDIILEVLDARFIEETRNKEMEQLVRREGKLLIYVVNKSDLVDIPELQRRLEMQDMKPLVFVSCKSGKGRTNLRQRIRIEVKRLKLTFKRAHVGVIGYPNTGKSTLINFLLGRPGATTSQQAGHTKGIQRLRLSKDILLLDTPGVIPDKEYAQDRVKKHTQIGVRTYDKVKEPVLVVVKVMQENPGLLEWFYEIPASGDAEVLLEEMGKRRHFLKKGNAVDLERTARDILKDWQSGKITKVK